MQLVTSAGVPCSFLRWVNQSVTWANSFTSFFFLQGRRLFWPYLIIAPSFFLKLSKNMKLSDTTFSLMAIAFQTQDKNSCRIVEFKSVKKRHKKKRLWQNKSRRADLRKSASNFISFAPGICQGPSVITDAFFPNRFKFGFFLKIRN